MPDYGNKILQGIRALIYLSAIGACVYLFILGLTSCSQTTPTRGEWVSTPSLQQSLSRGGPEGPPWPWPPEPQEDNIAFWPPDMIPHPHLPSPPKKDDLA